MSKVQTEVSSALFWHPYTGSVDKEPLFVQYQRYQAQSATSSDLSFYIESPANGVLLDNEVWLYYQLVLTDDIAGDTDDGALNENLGQVRSGWAASNNDDIFIKGWANCPNYYTAFRSGLPMQRTCQNVALDINGTVMTYELSKYHDAMNRLYISQEEAPTVFSTSSGGGFDDGNHLGCYDHYFPIKVGEYGTDLRTSVTVPAADDLEDPASVSVDITPVINGYKTMTNVLGTGIHSISSFVPESQHTFNKGFRQRGDNLEFRWRTANISASSAVDAANVGAGASSGARYANSVIIKCYEKLCFSPFHFYDNRDIKMSIPNIRTLQLTFQFHNNQKALMFRSAVISTEFTMDWWTANKPQLLMRWYTPPGGYAIPKQISIPISKMWNYTNATLSPSSSRTINNSYILDNAYSWSDSFSVSNISLPAMPDLFILFFKRRLGSYTQIMPDDYNLSIDRIQIDMEGNSGKLNNCDSIQLWNMYRRHLRLYPVSRDSYINWRKYHCIVPITPSDLGVIKGAGFDNPIQISLSNIQLSYEYAFPSIGFQTNHSGNGYISPNFNPESENAAINIGSMNFDMHLVCVYDKYALTLTSDGSSELQLLRVNAGGTSTAPSNLGPSSLADISI